MDVLSLGAQLAESTMISVPLCLGKGIKKLPLVSPRSAQQPQGSPWPDMASNSLRSSIGSGDVAPSPVLGWQV